jgi:hypothetical protein
VRFGISRGERCGEDEGGCRGGENLLMIETGYDDIRGR